MTDTGEAGAVRRNGSTPHGGPAPQDGSTPHDGSTLPVLPMALGFDGPRSPCQAHRCTLCCHDTEMPLLASDIDRLVRHTGRAPGTFTVQGADGPMQLANRAGACVFLGPTGCTVYTARPAGCRLYPLVLDAETGRGVLDDDCPHTEGFQVTRRDRAALDALVAALYGPSTGSQAQGV